MTIALCFNCGHTKFGALNPCRVCGQGSTGNVSLDIAFSDHQMAVSTIEEFGAVIQAINAKCSERGLAFWTFAHYVSTHHASIFTVTLDPSTLNAAEQVLAQIELPPVTVLPSWKDEFFRQAELSDEADSE